VSVDRRRSRAAVPDIPPRSPLVAIREQRPRNGPQDNVLRAVSHDQGASPSPAEFGADLEIRGEERFGYKVLAVSSAAVPDGIAAICLAMRDEFGLIPHVYFDWTEGSPLMPSCAFILWGSGEVAPVTREILCRADPTSPAARTYTWAEDRPDPATANYKRVISRAEPRSPRWPGRVPRAW
jgi:hypothetical protein